VTQINTQVCIDFKLAYQQQPDMQPEFMALTDCKFVTHPRQIPELPNQLRESQIISMEREAKRADLDDYGPKLTWFPDNFIAYQQKMRSAVKQDVQAVLEDLELDNLGSEKSRKRVMQTMAEHDLLRLLPCVVPGYALLLRKWGMSFIQCIYQPVTE
jgi:hypothetical protein